MKILAVETSCDETAAAVISDADEQHKHKARILSSKIYTQMSEHLPYGGVVPEIAARAHTERLSHLTTEALAEANCTLANIDAIAATTGPGLAGGLSVGASFAKSIALATNKPFIAVNHLEGHALMAMLTEEIEPPYLLLLASGGHCQFITVKAIGEYEVVGETRDDAIGECFDKTAKMLGLSYPGGPEIEKYAAQGNAEAFTLPIPLKDNSLDFSFSGLKTAVRQHIMTQEQPLSEETKANICAVLQRTITQTVIYKAEKALQRTQMPRFVLSGGVAANKELRKQLPTLCEKHGATFHAPPIGLCTDNAVMIAYAGLQRFKQGHQAPLSAPIRPNWPLTKI